MRFVAPARGSLYASVLQRMPLAGWRAPHAGLLDGPGWPDIDRLERARADAIAADGIARPAFVAQTPVLLADGLHYEQRVAAGRIATRADNWHDLFNALAWLRHPRIKHALNRRQVAEIARVGPRERSRAQCALTHFDEGGVIVLCADAGLLDRWDAHDWPALFDPTRAVWGTRIGVVVFGHAILEHALQPGQLLVGKAIACEAEATLVDALEHADTAAWSQVDARVAALIDGGVALVDPQELRPLPLSGIPGWHARAGDPEFLAQAPCFRPLRAGRRYPPAHRW